MPAAVSTTRHEVPGVVSFAKLLDSLLARSMEVKSTPAIDPALQKTDFDALDDQLARALAPSGAVDQEHGGGVATQKVQQFAVIETAVRDMFSNLIVR